MTRLSHTAYLDHITSESARLRAVLAQTDPATPVPTAPDWTAADLLWHVAGEVQHFWAYVLRSRPDEPTEKTYEEPKRPSDATLADLLERFDEINADFVATLAALDPEEPVWSWSQEQTAAFTYRRQAHELLIHRLDAELTAGAVTPLDPALAADGVEEVLDLFYGGTPAWATFTGGPEHLRVDATDTATSTWVRLGVLSGTDPDGEHVEEPDLGVVPAEEVAPGTEPDVVISGAAEDLDAWLWRRRDDSRIRVSGDQAVYERFRALTNQPINDD